MLAIKDLSSYIINVGHRAKMTEHFSTLALGSKKEDSRFFTFKSVRTDPFKTANVINCLICRSNFLPT